MQSDDEIWGKLEAALLPAIENILQQGPMSLHKLTRMLHESGQLDLMVQAWHNEEQDELPADEFIDSLAHSIDELLSDSDKFHTTSDQQTASVTQILKGAIFTHRLTDDELQHGMIDATIDFPLFDFDLEYTTELPLSSDGMLSGEMISLDADWPGFSTPNQLWWSGPANWLADFLAGDLIACQRIDGALAISAATQETNGEAVASAIRQSFDEMFTPEDSEEITFLSLETLARNPDLFQVANPPLTELIETAGLSRKEIWIGQADKEWGRPDASFRKQKIEAAAQLFDLDSCCRTELKVAIDALTDERPAESHRITKALDHGLVLAAFVEYLFRDSPDVATSADNFSLKLDGNSNSERAIILYLNGVAAESRGDALDAEAAFMQAHLLEDDQPSIMLKLAEYTADRGDSKTTLSVLRHVAGKSLEVDILELLHARAPQAGRNDPCPCGSGRKFKACCQNNPKISAHDRWPWLQYRLTRFALSGQARQQMLALAAVAFDQEILNGNITFDTQKQAFLADLITFEGGGVDRYLDQRGPLFDAVDRALLESWKLSKRELWEVIDIDFGVSIALRNTSNGDQLTVKEKTASQQCEVGDYMLARIVQENGEHYIFTDPLRVPLSQRQTVLELMDNEPEITDIARWWGSLHRPPKLQNTEGHDLLFCTAMLRPRDPWDDIEMTLDEFFKPDETHEQDAWIHLGEADDGNTVVRGNMQREGDLLRVSANSSERLAELMVELEELGLEYETVDVKMEDPSELREQASELQNVLDDSQMAPEVLEAVDQYMQQQERQWIDLPVPALNGLTPRQALDDPTRQEDLQSLLRDMDRHWEASPHQGFNPARIRTLLGL